MLCLKREKKSVLVVFIMTALLNQKKFEIEFNANHIQSINWYNKIKFCHF